MSPYIRVNRAARQLEGTETNRLEGEAVEGVDL
jgi:hypothetical protein